MCYRANAKKLRSVAMTMTKMRGVYAVIENPIRSALFKVDSFKGALVSVSASRYTTCLGAFGATSLKPLELQSTVPDVYMAEYLVRSSSQGLMTLKYTSMIIKSFRQTLYKKTVKSVVQRRPSAGKKKKTKRAKCAASKINFTCFTPGRMRDSSAYEPRFCQAVANMCVAMRCGDTAA